MILNRVRIRIQDPVFFSTREMNKKSVTGTFLHNYALTYASLNAIGAMDMVTEYTRSWEKDNSGPYYEEDFKDIEFYLFPATPRSVRASTEIVNTTSETYEEIVNADRGKQYFSGHKVQRLDIGSTFETYLLSGNGFELPDHARLGKFMSKIKLESEECSFKRIDIENDNKSVDCTLNSLDVPADFISSASHIKIEQMRPSPLITDATISGEVIRTENDAILPTDVGYHKANAG